MVCTIRLDCPVCYTGNYISGKPGDNLSFICEGCGKQMSRNGSVITLPGELGECLICGCDRYYTGYNFPFFWRKNIFTCYCCETSYRGFHLSNKLEPQYNLFREDVLNKPCCKEWRVYIRALLAGLEESGYSIPYHPDRDIHMLP